MMPVGCVGELVIQGHLLARGYLNATVEAAGAWIENADWFPGDVSRRAYRTGDLVRRNEDGTFDYLGRRDNQVKLHGQRIELGEVESQMEDFIPDNMACVAETLEDEGTGDGVLVALLWHSHSKSCQDEEFRLVDEINEEMHGIISHLDTNLGVVLPSYMTPSMYFVFRGTPKKTTSGKVDRRKLRQILREVPAEQRVNFTPGGGSKRVPITDLEFQLRDLWSEVLHIAPDAIGRDDNFLRIGGDSMASIRLVSLAQNAGIVLTVSAIFANPVLHTMALQCRQEVAQVRDAVTFSLLSVDKDRVIKSAVEELNLASEEEIEDVYPISSFQDGLMALSVKQPGTYTGQVCFRLSDDVDIERFRSAWETTLEQCGNLRTRIIRCNGVSLQVVTHHTVDWEPYQTFKALGNGLSRQPMTYGSKLCRYSIIQESGSYFFVLIIHHTVYDGWTLNLVIETLLDAYDGQIVSQLQPYSNFISYLQATDEECIKSYWRHELKAAKKTAFPRAPDADSTPITRHAQKIVHFPQSYGSSITKATLLRAAYALVLARYSDTEDVTFGMTLSGRQAPVPGLDRIPGATVSTVPVRVKFDPDDNVADFLQQVQAKASEMIGKEYYGLQNISKLGADAEVACAFNSLLVVQPFSAFESLSDGSGQLLQLDDSRDDFTDKDLNGFFNYPLVVQCQLGDEEATLSFTFDSVTVPEARILALGEHIDRVISQFVPTSEVKLSALDISSTWDLEQVKEWNRCDQIPEMIEQPWHSIFEEHAKLRPHAPAIDAWDRTFTYKELDDAANMLARYLIQSFGLKERDMVIACFEKSAWYFVSILAVNKAGATWVPLDPNYPVHRQKQILAQTGSNLVLTSPAYVQNMQGLAETVVEISPSLHATLAENDDAGSQNPGRDVSSDTAAYILFTSGSTGVPKGFVMEHSAVVSSLIPTGNKLGITSDTRMLQFAALVFDFSIGEILCTLLFGGCLHVPSEDTRMNGLETYMRNGKVNCAFLTPSFVRTLHPDLLPDMEILVLGGEEVGQDILDAWFGKLRLINIWGPGEAACICTVHEYTSASDQPNNIGRPTSDYCWVVDSENHERLAPVGAVGEILIQGPTLLREYLGDAVKTAASIINELPEWAVSQRSTAGWGRMYKTGDLASYNVDGSILFSSRKDTQIKIRGLRVELGEVEYHIRRFLPDLRQLAVDLFKTETGSSLVAYLCFSEDTREGSTDGLFQPLSTSLQRQLVELSGKLGISLPSYMIPTMFVPCVYMPIITSTKLDRKALKVQTLALSKQEISSYSLNDSDKRAPETKMEILLQSLWSELLNIPLQSIGRDDSFLRLGGDSLAAIQLVQSCRENGLSIAVRDIFKDARLFSIASVCEGTHADTTTQDVISPFDLVSPRQRELVLGETIRSRCGLTNTQNIQDAYPCIPIQSGLMALSLKQPGAYILKRVYKLSRNINLARFKKAWEQTVELSSSLRTRIIDVEGQMLQCVIQGDFAWDDVKNHTVKSYVTSSRTFDMGYDTRLTRCAIIEEDGDAYFIMVNHHAVTDGWLIQLMFESLYALYYGESPAVSRPYADFVRYVMKIDREEAKAFWTAQLAEAKPSAFPSDIKTATKASAKYSSLTRGIQLPGRITDGSVTKATIVRAAYAIVLGKYCATEDVCFGATVSGRTAPVPGIEGMLGPALTTVPVRIPLDPSTSARRLLDFVQTQASEMSSYEQFGLQNIAQVSQSAKEACEFSSLLSIVPGVSTSGETSDEEALLEPALNDFGGTLDNYLTMPLTLEATVYDDSVQLSIFYNVNIMSNGQAEALYHHMDNVIQQLVQSSDRSLADLSVAGAWDIQQSLEWNSGVYEEHDRCIHDLFKDQVVKTPNDIAIYTTRQSMTYAELDALSDRLAQHLADLGVGPETLVPVCLEKSAWALVAIIGVLKAGGAYVPLDPAHVIGRREEILKQVDANYLLVSPQSQKEMQHLAPTVITISEESLFAMPPPTSTLTNEVKPHNMAYVIFSSGSTGKPKGIVVEHRAACTSMMNHGRLLYHGSDNVMRCVLFGSFAFDVTVFEMFLPLATGGIVCIPSDEERLQGFADFATHSKTNIALLSPSFSRTISPNQVPTLDTLVLIGEAANQSDISTWFDHVRLLNGYGPTETCVLNNVYEYTGSDDSPRTLGHTSVNRNWVVNPDDPQQLLPIGCVGELLVQGPSLARGYYNDQERTDAVFLAQGPKGLPAAADANVPARCYRTGDLVSYNSNGTIEYRGRIDHQVKIRGQRVELGEVEHHIKKASDEVETAVSRVVEFGDRQVLVALISFNNSKSSGPASFMTPDKPMLEYLKRMADDLGRSLPSYMVPSYILPLNRMPLLSASLKIDHQQLQLLLESLSHEDLLSFSARSADKVEPTTEAELKLRKIWSAILGLDERGIGKHDDFLRVGGDSISAIQLASAAQERGMRLRVADIFRDSRLSSMAARYSSGGGYESLDTEPFELVSTMDTDSILRSVQAQTQDASITEAELEDVFPTHILQDSFMQSTATFPGVLMAKRVWKLPQHVDVQRFCRAWDGVVRHLPNLRTRIVRHGDGNLQVVLRGDAEWEDAGTMSVREYISARMEMNMEFGAPLSRQAIVKENGENYFVWIHHHAVVDGWTLSMIVEQLRRSYFGEALLPVASYPGFVKYSRGIDLDVAGKYWTNSLSGATGNTWPTIPSADVPYRGVKRFLERSITLDASSHASVTLATVVTAAWGLALSKLNDTNDVCFMMTSSGRQAPLQALESVPGITTARVPVRVRVEDDQTVSEFLRAVQDYVVNSVPHEHYGVANMADLMPELGPSLVAPTSQVAMQPAKIHDAASKDADDAGAIMTAPAPDVYSSAEAIDGFHITPLVTDCFIGDTRVDISSTYNYEVLTAEELGGFYDRVERNIRFLWGHSRESVAPMN